MFRQKEKTINVGDEVVIGDKEHFYVISTNDKTTTLIAKYNIYTGFNVSYDELENKIIEKVSEKEEDYGVQSSKTLKEGIGVVPFSAQKYWTNYENIYNGSVYNPNFKDQEPLLKKDYSVVKNDYTIAYYVEKYKDKLKEYGLEILDARLLTNEEAASLECSKESNCPWYKNEWIKNVVREKNRN